MFPTTTKAAGPTLRWIAAAASALACAISAPAVWTWARFMLQEPFTNDSSMYWTIGRGIVNGLTPYIDLFDHKMPGIFLISALSLKVTKDLRLAYAFETFIVVAIPLLPALAVIQKLKWDTAQKLAAPLSTAAFGAILSIYIVIRVYGYQTEHFGAFFACLYAIALFSMIQPTTAFNRVILATLILMSVGIKEPFGAILPAIALIKARNGRHFLQIFVWPFLIAAAAGLIIVTLCGWLPAFGIFIREVFTFVSPGGVGEHRSLLERMSVYNLFFNFWNFSIAGTIALLVLISASIFGGSGAILRRTRLLKVSGALILTSLAVNSGPNLYPHHFAMAVPVFLAFFLKFQSEFISNPESIPHAVTTASLSVLILIATLFLPEPPYGNLMWSRHQREMVQETANRIDSLLDACGNPPWASVCYLSYVPIIPSLTRHSPVGPVFCLLSYSATTSAYVRQSISGWMGRADLVVEQAQTLDTDVLGDLRPVVKAQIRQDFTQEPWECAKNVPLPDDGTRLYFRRGARPQHLPAAEHP